MGMIRRTRIFILLFILFLVAMGSWLSHARLTDWNDTVWVAVYPIVGDDSRRTAAYVAGLDEAKLRPIERFMRAQARRYRLPLRQPLKVLLGPMLAAQPPAPPTQPSMLSVVLWSLQFRYWAWRHDDDSIPAGIDLFVVYHDPDRQPAVPHSLGLKEGHIGLVHAFADTTMTRPNNVVITHELLHTLGASDKYDLATGLPIHPQGFAEPEREPLYPQRQAEIMAVRIPLSERRAVIPNSLKQTMLNAATAQEIGWLP